jgi:hypothetical protein
MNMDIDTWYLGSLLVHLGGVTDYIQNTTGVIRLLNIQILRCKEM